MPFLTLPTFGDVPVGMDAGAAVLEYDEVGGRERAMDGTMHSSVRTQKRRWRVATTWVSRANGDSILSVLTGTQPLACSGDLLGGSVTCHAEIQSIRHRKFSAGEFQQIEFVLHEE